MGNMIKNDSLKLVVFILLSLGMILFTYSGYTFINLVIKIIWSVVFLATVLYSSILIRHLKQFWVIRLYIISYILMIMLTVLSPEIFTYLHLLSLLMGLLLYPYKKYSLVKRIITGFPLLFFTLILTLMILNSLFGFTKTTVVAEVKNDTSKNVLILEYHDLGATGGNYSLLIQRSIIENFLIFEKVQISYLDWKPEEIIWVDRNSYTIDGIKNYLK